MARYDRLSAQDLSFLYAESPVAHMHVGSLVVFEDRGLTEERFLEHIQSRMHLVPRFRKKLAWVPYDQGRPIWVDDPHFDLRFHIRLTGLPKPGEMEQALKLTGRLMSIPLDRSRPLWELWLFDLPDGRKGLIQKTHHCLIDGMSGIDLGTVLLDLEPDPPPPSRPEPWQPAPAPSRWELLRDTLVERFTAPGDIARELRSAAEKGQGPRGRLGRIASGLRAFSKAGIELAPKTSLNVPIGAHRRFRIARASLAQVKAIKHRMGCKVNDVVLAAVSGGLRRILVSRGEDVTGLVLRAMVPVSVRDPSERMTFGNRVSMMTVDLPVGEADPARRLELIAQRTAGSKESGQAIGAEFWLKLAKYASPTMISLAARAVASQRMVNLTVTNVPGPQFPLYLCGGRMLEAFPFVPLLGTMAVGVAVISYDGQLNFGVSGDWDAVPDLQVFADGIAASVEELAGAGLQGA